LYAEYIEYLIIQTLRKSKTRVKDKQLLENIDKFIRQEASHSKYHSLMNKLIDVSKKSKHHPKVYSALKEIHSLYVPIFEGLESGEEAGFKKALTYVVAGESSISIMADIFLKDFDKFYAISNPAILYLFSYHLIEEIEHSGLCIDVYQHIYKEKYWQKNEHLKLLEGAKTILVDYSIVLSIASKCNIDISAITEVALQKKIENEIGSQYQFLYEDIKNIIETHSYFHPWVHKKEEYIQLIHQWDKEWEPLLRNKINNTYPNSILSDVNVEPESA
jgi:predicted metal-dependent hydrolase